MEKTRKISEIETVLNSPEFSKIIENFKKLSEALIIMQENLPKISPSVLSYKIKLFDSFELRGINLQQTISELPKINIVGNVPITGGARNYNHKPYYDANILDQRLSLSSLMISSNFIDNIKS